MSQNEFVTRFVGEFDAGDSVQKIELVEAALRRLLEMANTPVDTGGSTGEDVLAQIDQLASALETRLSRLPEIIASQIRVTLSAATQVVRTASAETTAPAVGPTGRTEGEQAAVIAAARTAASRGDAAAAVEAQAVAEKTNAERAAEAGVVARQQRAEIDLWREEQILALRNQAAADRRAARAAETAAAKAERESPAGRTAAAETRLGTVTELAGGESDFPRIIADLKNAYGQLAQKVNEELGEHATYIDSQVALKQSQNDLASLEKVALADTQTYLESYAQLRRSTAALAAAHDEEVAATPSTLEAVAAARVAREKVAAGAAQALTPEQVGSLGESQQQRQQVTTQIKGAGLGLDPELLAQMAPEERQQVVYLQQQTDAQRLRVVRLQALLDGDSELAQLNTQAVALQQEINEKRRAEGAGGGGGGGGRGGGGGALGNVLGGLFGGGGGGGLGGALGDLGAIAGQTALFSAFFRIQSTISDSVKSAIELDHQLALVGQTAQAIGQGAQFGALRASILDTANNTGVAASQVATLAQEFLGLYQNASVAAIATDNAAKLINVIGANAAQAGPQIAAIAEDLGASTLDIGNAVLDIQQTTGRVGTEALAALGQVAPVANELNLTLDQSRGLIEAVAVGSAKSGQQIGEGLARILPEMQSNLTKLVKDGITLDVKAQTGDAKAALQDLFAQYGSLSQAQQQAVVRDLGGPRNAQILAAALADPKRALDALNSSIGDNNLLNERNAAAQGTLQGAFNRLKETFVTLGEALVRSGITTALKDIVSVGADVFGVIGRLAGVFGTINSALAGFPGRVLEVVLALRALSALSLGSAIADVFGFAAVAARSLTATIGGLFGARTADTGAATEEAGATGLVTDAEILNTGAARTAAIVTGEAAAARTAAAGTAAAGAAGAGAAGAGAAGAGAAEQLVLPGLEAGAAGGAAATLAPEVAASGPPAWMVAIVVAGAAVLHERLTSGIRKKVTATEAAFSKLTDDQLKQEAESASKEPVGTSGDIGTPIIKFLEPSGGPLTGFSKLFGGAAGGGESARQAAQKELNRRTVAAQNDAYQAILNNGVADAKEATKIQKALQDPGKDSNFKYLESEYNKLAATPKGQQAVAAAAAIKARQDALNQLGANLADDFQSVSDVSAGYQTGDVDFATAKADMQKVVAADKETAGIGPVQFKTYLKDKSDMQKFLSQDIVDNVKAVTDFQQQYLGQGPQAQVANIEAVLSGSEGVDLTIAARAQLGQQLLAAEQATYTKALQEATSISDINKLLEQGFQVSLQAADAANEAAAAAGRQLPFAELAAREAQGATLGAAAIYQPDAAAGAISALPKITPGLTKLPSTEVDTQAGAAAAKALGDQQISLARLQGESARRLAQRTLDTDRQILGLYQAALAAATPGSDQAKALAVDVAKAQADVNNAQVAVTQSVLAQIQAEASFLQAFYKNNPILAAQAGMAEIQKQVQASPFGNISKIMSDIRAGTAGPDEIALGTQYVQAGQAATDAANALADAQGQYAVDLARSSGDTIGAARANVAKLQGDINRLQAQGGGGTAAMIGLRDQMLQAQADLRTAQNAVVDAQIQYASDLATAAGDPVRAGQYKIQELRTQIAQLRAKGATTGNSPELLGLLGQLAIAQTDQISTFINTAVQHTQDSLDLRRIGAGQAIANLEATLKAAAAMGANQTQLDALQKQINNIVKTTEGDLNWNIGQIAVPTLYQARRLEATGSSSAYQDNRTQAITINVHNAQDNPGAVNALLDAVGGPSRTGTALPVLSAL